MKLTVTTFLTLDGVGQGPGGPDEDSSGAFEYGGWLPAYFDDDCGNAIDESFRKADAFLLGRKTYEIFAGSWGHVTDPDNPVAVKFHTLPKYVASRTVDKLDWANSTVLEGDVAEAVRALKAQPGNELQVHGSINLIQTLIRHSLVDEFRFLIFPVMLGAGKRVYDDIVPTALELVDTKRTGTGVMVQTYRAAGSPTYSTVGPLE